MKACCTPGNAPLSPTPHETVDRFDGGAVFVRTPLPEQRRRGMVRIPGGAFEMGWDAGTYPGDGEGPVRTVTLTPYWMDATTVTNRQFKRFVTETGYKTESEAFGWSFVFHMLVPEKIKAKLKQRVQGIEWWYKVPGACWKRPFGLGSDIRNLMDHPVVHTSWADAAAYCTWAGKRLPTEAEFECAARGGLVQQKMPWGRDLTPKGEHRCNIWQGQFPTENTAEDGFVGTCPARHYAPNGYGLYNMSGNVWEWCADWWSPDFHVTGPRTDPAGPASGTSRVIRGGSFLCHDSYCNRYRTSARTHNTPDSATSNMGFRCVADEE